MNIDDIYMKEMEDAGNNNFSLIADFEGNEAQMMDIEVENEIPVLPLRNMVLFPGVFLPVAVGRKSSLKLVREEEANKGYVAVVSQKHVKTDDPQLEDLHTIGCVAKVVRLLEMPDRTVTAILQGVRRMELNSITQEHPYLKGEVTLLHETLLDKESKEDEALIESCKDLTIRYIKMADNIN
ncbi:MAG: LON peptidase substrate-binding domain-containing protein, partial [Bacteroides sp.]